MLVRRDLTALAMVVCMSVSLAGCMNSGSPTSESSPKSDSATDAAPEASPEVPVTVRLNVSGNKVAVNEVVQVSAEGGTLDSVTIKSDTGQLTGAMDGNGAWVARESLAPGTTYVVTSVARTADGQQRSEQSKFSTQDLPLDKLTYPSLAPLAGETVGVGMPVIVTFDVPVTDKKSIQKHMSVTSSPAQVGSWHWLNDQEAHWRPKNYWTSGTKVAVDIDIKSVPAGKGVYGQVNRHIDFQVGIGNIFKVNAQTHQMQAFSNGSLVRTIPITTGKPGFTTRSGVKVIIEKFASKRMNSETVGIAADSPEAYDIDNVKWAMRLTYSGEFIHGAPWSVGSQGNANVSHGCTGMSDANAKWLYAIAKRGDVVEYVGTDRPMTLDNGYGDWNQPFAEYAQGSAL
jgi:lipoprotein-anchoring transpeptidase ErfK/SrfK